MKYVAARPVFGRIGHQMSAVLLARFLAEITGATYLHAPFIDAGYDRGPADLWNEFLGLGDGEPILDVAERHRLTYSLPRYSRLGLKDSANFARLRSIIDAMPDEFVFEVADMALVNSDAAWEFSEQAFTNTVQWFQRKLDASPAYQATPVLDNCGRKHVAAYRRDAGRHEFGALQPQHILPPRYFSEIRRRLLLEHKPEELQFTLLTQGGADDPASHPDFLGYSVVVCDHDYPAVYSAFKTMVECDLFIGSTGGSTFMTQLYRWGRRPWLQCPSWTWQSGITVQGERWTIPEL